MRRKKKASTKKNVTFRAERKAVTKDLELWHHRQRFTDTVALTEQTAGQTCYWSWSMMEAGALHLLRLHPDKDSEGHRAVPELTHTHTHTHTHTRTHTHTHTPGTQAQLSLPHTNKHTCTGFIIIFSHHRTRWCAHTHRHALTQQRGNVSSTQRVFHYPSSSSPRMHHEHTCSSDELVYFLWGQCDRQCAVITVRMLPEWFYEWKTEPEQQ